MGPFWSAITSTILWFAMCLPYLIGNLVNDATYQSFMYLVVVPILVSVFMTVRAITPYFLVPWEIIIPLFVVIFGALQLISLISPVFKQGTDKTKKGSGTGIGYVSAAIAIMIFIGMLAYYYTALWQFNPMGLTSSYG
jgi:hypothetical protein